MSAPEYVPTKPAQVVRVYSSPPRRKGSWRAERPGEISEIGQPAGAGLGSHGPDQGYALTLLKHFEGRLHLRSGEHRGDVEAGCVAVALKRASGFGRAPMIHDLTAAFTIWGYLDEDAPEPLVALRRRLFEEVSNPHHYQLARTAADAVPDDVLHQPLPSIIDAYRSDWRSLVSGGQ